MKLGKKKLTILSVCAFCIIGTAGAVLIKPANAQQAPRTREYPANIATITVGVDASGSITSKRKRQMSDLGVKLDDYTIKKGDYIKTGESVATLLKSDIEAKLNLADTDLKTAEFELNKAKRDKADFITDADQKLAQTRGGAQSSRDEKAAPINAKIKSLKAQIKEKTNAIKKLEADIKGYEDEKALNKPDAPDYDAFIQVARIEIDKIKAEKALQDAELSSANAQIKVYEDEYLRSQNSEDNSVESQKRQNSSSLLQHDSTISNAVNKYNDALKKQETLKQLLANPEIKAEHEGVVLDLGFTAGAEINSSAPLLETGAKEDIYLDLAVDAIDFSDIVEGQEVSFYVDAYPDATFGGTVKSKSYIQNENGKFGITVSVIQGEEELYNGMGASATLIIKQKKDVLTLQNKAILIENGKQYVNIRNEKGDLEKREIKTGFSDGKLTEILSGLNAGDIAVIEEHYENS